MHLPFIPRSLSAAPGRVLGEITEKEFPDKDILWRDWNDDTLRIIQEKNRPVLLFVADPNPFVWPILLFLSLCAAAQAALLRFPVTGKLQTLAPVDEGSDRYSLRAIRRCP
jgi:hypothetical protein